LCNFEAEKRINHFHTQDMKGWMYILLCANGQYYTGSTNNLERRLAQHQMGEGANFTRKHLPVKLVYFEEFQLVSDAFYREKQVQGWSRAKKEALINGDRNKLHELAKCRFDKLNDQRTLSEVEGRQLRNKKTAHS
jgi:putative endonuclease